MFMGGQENLNESRNYDYRHEEEKEKKKNKMEEEDDIRTLEVYGEAYDWFMSDVQRLEEDYNEFDDLFMHSDVLEKMSKVFTTYLSPSEIPYKTIDWGQFEVKLYVKLYDEKEFMIMDFLATELETRTRALKKFFGDDFTSDDILDFQLYMDGEKLDPTKKLKDQDVENYNELELKPVE